MNRSWTKTKNDLFYAACAVIILVQLYLCLFQIASYWQWGHNGYNGAAYQVAARNTIRHGILWPVQYHTDETKPKNFEYYTHAPLGLHLFTTLSVLIFGDHEYAVRIPPALFSLLSAIMLLIILARHFGRPLALVATAIYVLLPINTIYCNMTNHSTGCIFFALLMIDGYFNWLRSGRHAFLAEIAAGTIGATLFDWPGYTITFCLAIGAFYEGMKPHPEKGVRFTKELIFSLVALTFIVLSFKGYFMLIAKARGVDDVLATITNRSATSDLLGTVRGLYGSVITATFPKVVRYLAYAWLIILFMRHAAKKWRREDLLPVSFFVAAMAQFVLFPTAAEIHHYWNWQFNPFAAIACGQMIVWGAGAGSKVAQTLTSRWGRIAAQAASWCILLAVFSGFFLPTAWKKFTRGRAVAGSFNIPGYNRDYKKIMFGKLVESWTSPGEGVAIHTGLPHRIEFESCLDMRTWSDVTTDQLKILPEVLTRKKKWVLIGDMKKVEWKSLGKVAKGHPFVQVDSFFFSDQRKKEESVRVYIWKRLHPSLAWKLFFTPYDPPLALTRFAVLEERVATMLRNVPDSKDILPSKAKPPLGSKIPLTKFKD